jgi:hypothetical protein
MGVKDRPYIDNVVDYQLTMITAFRLRELNIINNEDFTLIEEKTAKKYCIKENSVYRQ